MSQVTEKRTLIGNIKELCDGNNRPNSVAELEREAGIPANTVYRWATITPGYDKVFKVAQVLNVTFEELIKGIEE